MSSADTDENGRGAHMAGEGVRPHGAEGAPEGQGGHGSATASDEAARDAGEDTASDDPELAAALADIRHEKQQEHTGSSLSGFLSGLPLKALGIVAVILIVGALLAGAFVQVGKGAVIATLYSSLIAGLFELALLALCIGAGAAVLLTGKGFLIKAFCVIESAALLWVFLFFFAPSTFGNLWNSVLDLGASPVRMGATFYTRFYDDEGDPDSIGISFDDGGFATWGSELETELADMGVTEQGDHFEAWVYPHTHILERLEDPASYS